MVCGEHPNLELFADSNHEEVAAEAVHEMWAETDYEIIK